MSQSSNEKTTAGSGLGLQKKLLMTFLAVGLVPMAILTACFLAGFSPLAALVAGFIAQAAGIAIAYGAIQGIAAQATAINETLRKIVGGDFEARAEKVTDDELGDAAIRLNEMCDNTLNLIQSSEERDQIQSSIESLINEMQEIAGGNLNITTDVKDDVTGPISESINRMTEQLRSIIQQVQTAAAQVTTSSARIQNASRSMSGNSEMQAVQITDASDQLVEMTASFQGVASLTQECVQVAFEARQSASNGLKAVSNTVEGMQRIRNQVQSTSKRIKRLGESSQEIGEIVQMISDIADRTSILALNASIQASMAGDAGQGFAIVAEEIERLAESSSDATKQISQLIRSVQSETSEVVADMEESTREVVAGSHLADQAGATLFEIDSVSNQLVELIESSCNSALEQAEKATAIAHSMSQISMSTKDSAEKSRDATRAVKRLTDRVGQLRDSVSQFDVGSSAFETPKYIVDESNDLETPVAEDIQSLEQRALANDINRGAVKTIDLTDDDSYSTPLANPATQKEETVLKEVREATMILGEANQKKPRQVDMTVIMNGQQPVETESGGESLNTIRQIQRTHESTVFLDDSENDTQSS